MCIKTLIPMNCNVTFPTKPKLICSDVPGESDGYFMRAHTITVLIFLIGCLVYVAFFDHGGENNTSDINSKRGLLAALYFWLALGMTIMPDGPFSR